MRHTLYTRLQQVITIVEMIAITSATALFFICMCSLT